MAKFKSGQYRFKATGTVFYCRLSGDDVMMWKGYKASHTNYCGAKPLNYFLAQFEKV